MAWFDDLELPGSTIAGYFGFVHEDGPDEDDYPDIRLATGKVRFEPTAKAVKAGGAWIGIAPVEAEVFDGELITSEDDPRPPRILSTDADTGVKDWGWRATFDIRGASIKPVTFLAPTSGVHLTGDLIPVTGLPVEVIGAGAMDRLVTAEDLIEQHASRITAVEAKADETREIVDRIKHPALVKGRPTGTAPVGTLVLDVETFDVWEATE